MKRILAFASVFALLAVGVFGQTPRNPTAIAFTSVDHDLAAVTGYEVDIVRSSDNVTVQTLNVAKSTTTKLPTGEIRVTLNVQPIAFGQYRVVVRTVAGTLESDNSLPSDMWERVPGAPSKPAVQ